VVSLRQGLQKNTNEKDCMNRLLNLFDENSQLKHEALEAVQPIYLART
jgi:hypothetical protein